MTPFLNAVDLSAHARAILDLWFHRENIHGEYGASGAYKVVRAVSIDTIVKHLRGERLIGTYPVRQGDGTVVWAAWDGDAHGDIDKGLAEACTLALCGELLSTGATPVLEDSGGGFHVWLRFDEPVDARDAFAWAKALAERHGVAEWWPAYQDPTKIGKFLRLPGRHPTIDHYSKFLDFHTGEWVPWPDGLALFTDPVCAPASFVPRAPQAPAKKPANSPRGPTLRDLELARRCLPFVKCYGEGTHDDGWLDVIMALHDASDGSDEGLVLGAEWSKQGGGAFDEQVLQRKWRSFDRSEGNRITVGTLVYMAREGGATDRELFAGLGGARSEATPGVLSEGAMRREKSRVVAHEGPLAVTIELLRVREKGQQGHCEAEFRVRREGVDVGTIAVSTAPTPLSRAPRELCCMVSDHCARKLTGSEEHALRSFFRPLIAPDRLRAQVPQHGNERDGPRSADVVTVYLRKYARPVFRGTRGRIFFESYERAMGVSEFVGTVPRELLDELSQAADLQSNASDTQRAAVVQRLARVAFDTFRTELPLEAEADGLGPDSAAAKAMRNAVLRLWHAPLSFGAHADTLAVAASRVRAGGGWARVGGLGTAAFVHVRERLVAMRHELARGQVRNQEIESAVSLGALGRILKRYGLLHDECDTSGKQIRVQKPRIKALVLSDELSAEILEGGGQPEGNGDS